MPNDVVRNGEETCDCECRRELVQGAALAIWCAVRFTIDYSALCRTCDGWSGVPDAVHPSGAREGISHPRQIRAIVGCFVAPSGMMAPCDSQVWLGCLHTWHMMWCTSDGRNHY